MTVEPPERDQRERVRDDAGLDEALERDQQRRESRDSGGRECHDAGPRRSSLDPGDEADQEQRCDDEEVSLLNPVGREAGGERRHRDGEPARQRDRHGEVLLETAWQAEGACEQDESRCDR